jgi:ATP-dependent RNA helicase DHX37/DHR1
VFNDQFEEYAKPEVERLPMDGMCLNMKSMGIDDLDSFPFPSPPEPLALQKATKHLKALGAVSLEEEKITDLGYSLSLLPVAPRYAKMLVLGHQGGCLPYVLALVAMLAVGDPVLHDIKEEGFAPGEKRIKKSNWRHPTSNLLGSLKAVGAYEWAGATEKFCSENGLHQKTMKEIHDLRVQLCRIVNTLVIDGKSPNIPQDWSLDPPNANQEKLLQQIIISGFIDQVARRIDQETVMQQPELARGYLGCTNTIPCWIHPHSSVGVHSAPEYVVYQDIVVGKRATMRGITMVPADILYRLGNSMCSFSTPMEDPPPWYDTEKDSLMCFAVPRFGEHSWDLPVAPVPLPVDYKDRYRVFGRLLLDGHVCHALKKFVPSLKMKPSSVMGRVAQPRVVSLLRALGERKVDSLPTLHREWAREPKFLLDVFLLWTQPSVHAEIRKMWPPMQKNLKKKKKKQ